MRVLVFGASTSRQSINRALARHAAARLRSELVPDLEIDDLDLNDLELPVFSVDVEREEGIPEAARQFVARIGSADGVVVSYAEHNGHYTAAFKNLFDWASRLGKAVFQGKPVFALATSNGPRGAARVLLAARESAPFFGAELVASLSVPRFGAHFDVERGELTDPGLAGQLGGALQRFAARLKRGSAGPGEGGPKPGAGMWDQRYAASQTAYGSQPNDFLAAVAGRIPSGPVLVIAAGEGRDAVHLAELGFEVTAMDQSAVGMANAAALAASRGVSLQTEVADLADFDLGESCWAGIVAIWTHLPPPLRERVHAACVRALQPGGVFVLEAYGPDHLALPGRGGPPVLPMLFDAATARRELDGLDFDLAQDVRREVSEGLHHQGWSATTQILAVRR